MIDDCYPEICEKLDQLPLNVSDVLSDKARILIVDDDIISRRLLSELLRTEHIVMLAASGKEALEKIENFPPDLVILDIMMPEMSGFQLIRKLKNDSATRSIPVVFITALNSIRKEEKGLKLGAVDYITKPFMPSIVEARIGNIMTMVRQRKLLETLAHVDGLTEIPNRRYFDQALSREWQRAMRDNNPLSVALADVDFFKQYNDNYGHASGDRVLRALARELRSNLKRPYDLAARYGGEEFGVILPNTSADKAAFFCESIRSAVESLNIPHEFSAVSDLITISIGGATIIPAQNMALTHLVELADRRLYTAKNRGRNQVQWLI
jgi:diguanylate cyclase (GGDEF)-like protein